MIRLAIYTCIPATAALAFALARLLHEQRQFDTAFERWSDDLRLIEAQGVDHVPVDNSPCTR